MGLLKKPGLLVWDSFRPNMSENIKKKFKQMKIDTVIPYSALFFRYKFFDAMTE